MIYHATASPQVIALVRQNNLNLHCDTGTCPGAWRSLFLRNQLQDKDFFWEVNVRSHGQEIMKSPKPVLCSQYSVTRVTRLCMAQGVSRQVLTCRVMLDLQCIKWRYGVLWFPSRIIISLTAPYSLIIEAIYSRSWKRCRINNSKQEPVTNHLVRETNPFHNTHLRF